MTVLPQRSEAATPATGQQAGNNIESGQQTCASGKFGVSLGSAAACIDRGFSGGGRGAGSGLGITLDISKSGASVLNDPIKIILVFDLAGGLAGIVIAMTSFTRTITCCRC